MKVAAKLVETMTRPVIHFEWENTGIHCNIIISYRRQGFSQNLREDSTRADSKL